MLIATAAGVRSNLELTLPIVLIVFVFVFAWDRMCVWLEEALSHADPLERPLTLLHDTHPEGVVERRSEDRERARRERDEARQSRQHMEGMRR